MPMHWYESPAHAGTAQGYETVCMLKIMQKRPPDAMPIAVHGELVRLLGTCWTEFRIR